MVSTDSTVLGIAGSPMVVHRDTPGFALPGDAIVGRGSSIKADEGSRVSLALSPSTLIEVLPTTDLEVITLAIKKDGNETATDSMRRRDAHVELRRGGLVASQERPDVQAEPNFTIDTAEGSLVTSFDCTFLITRDENGTRVVCASGLLYFQAKGQPTAAELEGGSFGQWSAERSEVAAAKTNAIAQAELSQVLEVVPKLRALRDARRNKLPAANSVR